MVDEPRQVSTFRALSGAAAIALLVDQASKWAVVRQMRLELVGQIDVFPPFLTFRYGENRGINFGLFDSASANTPWILVAISLALSLAVSIWVLRGRKSFAMAIAAGFLVGGALGNVVDRALYGYVRDFLNMSCCGLNNPYVFNVADVFIFVGAIGLAFLDMGDGKPAGGGGSRKGKKRS